MEKELSTIEKVKNNKLVNDNYVIKDLENAINNNMQPSEENRIFKLRSNLTNSYLRFKNDKIGNVAFLGGSITAMHGWSNLITDMIREEFLDAEINFINAGIPSFDSTEHVFRFDLDVLSKGKIDLLFIEAAVNDEVNGRKSEEIIKSFEGIIRKAYNSNNNMDIVIMYFIDDHKIEQTKIGNTMNIIDIQESVAQYYNITAIDMATKVITDINDGKYTWDEFGGIHPLVFGHEIYVENIENLLRATWKTVTDETVIIDKNRDFTDKLIDENSYINGKYMNINKVKILDDFKFNKNWSPIDTLETRQGFVNVPIIEAIIPYSSLTFGFKGTAIGILDITGPDSGIIEYSVDGNQYKKIDLFTKWSSSVHLPWAHMMEINLEDKNHIITIRTISEKNSLSKGYSCKIRYILVNTDE